MLLREESSGQEQYYFNCYAVEQSNCCDVEQSNYCDVEQSNWCAVEQSNWCAVEQSNWCAVEQSNCCAVEQSNWCAVEQSNCCAVEQSSQSISQKSRTDCSKLGIPPVYKRHNIFDGPTPHVAIPVEEIPEYFTKDNWQYRIDTIRTIGIVRRFERESYSLESVDKKVKPTQVPLSRGTNRELKYFENILTEKKLQVIRKNDQDDEEEEAGINLAENKNNAQGKLAIVELPFPDSVQDPLSLGDTRVKDGAVYMVLGTLRWANGKPIIDVDRFVPVLNLKTTYDVFLLQHKISRKHVDLYKAHWDEIGEVVRRPYE